MLCGMADTQPGRSFDMRRSAVVSRLAASRLAAFPLTLFTLGEAASFSHAPVCGHVVGRPLRLAAFPLTLFTLGKLRLSPMRWPLMKS